MSGIATSIPPAGAPLGGSPRSAEVPELVHDVTATLGATTWGSTCDSGACGHPPARPDVAPTSRVLGSTPTNWYIGNWSGEGMIRENPNNPDNLVSGARTYKAAAANDTTTYYAHGLDGEFTSWDGGRTWNDQYLPTNPDWTDPNSTLCSRNHGGDGTIGFGPGGVVYFVDLVAATSNPCPKSSTGIAIYVTVSHDGGDTWNTPVAIAGTAPGTSLERDWIAVDQATGEAYVVYSDFTDFWNNTSVWIQNSTDEGANWSNPVELTTGNEYGLGAQVVVDPSGGVDVAWLEATQSADAIQFVRSIDHGATFTAEVTVAVPPTTYASSFPDGFIAGVFPDLGVDGSRGNAFTGTLFSVWQNGAGGVTAGNPTVLLSRSTDNGSTWSSPIHVSSNPTEKDFTPSVAVGSDGAVYVDWYGVNSSTGSYRLQAALSVDGGQTFAPEVSVSDVDSNPSTSAGPDFWLGDYTDMIGDATGARPIWTDTRSTEGWNGTGPFAPSALYNMTVYTALLVNDSVAASIPVDVALDGTVANTGLATVGPVPSPSLWLVGATYNVSAPPTALWNGSTYYFDYWYGGPGGSLWLSTASNVSGTVAGGEHLVACFSLQPGGTCQSPGAPGFLGVSVLPVTAGLTVDGVTPPPGELGVPLPVPTGIHWVNATAPGYYPLNVSVLVTPGNTSWGNLSLELIMGTISGTVDPTTASVRVGSTQIAVFPDGSFSGRFLPGTYSVVASAPRYFSYTNASVLLAGSATVFLPIVLDGFPGWINGSVTPASLALVTLNGGSLSVDPTTGAFSAHVAPGTYWVNASAAGYLPVGSGPLVLGPFGATTIDLSLRQVLGTLAGLVVPATAAVTVNGTVVTTTNGLFEISLPPADYPLTVSANGYDPLGISAVVRFNQTTQVVLTLNVSEGWISGAVEPTNAILEVDGSAVTVDAGGSFNVSARPGTHHLQASSDGYLVADQNVTVNAGRTTHASPTLVKIPPSSGTSADVVPFILLTAVVAVGIIGVTTWRRRRQGPFP